jgi:hypothetical protein
MSVDPSAVEQTSNSQRLRTDYRAAFRVWATRVSRVRDLIASAADRLDVKKANEQAISAELLYRDSRNRLMNDLNRRDEWRLRD